MPFPCHLPDATLPSRLLPALQRHWPRGLRSRRSTWPRGLRSRRSTWPRGLQSRRSTWNALPAWFSFTSSERPPWLCCLHLKTYTKTHPSSCDFFLSKILIANCHNTLLKLFPLNWSDGNVKSIGARFFSVLFTAAPPCNNTVYSLMVYAEAKETSTCLHVV